MLNPTIATVFGGSGFLGRYVVSRLRKAGHIVRVASRDPARAAHLRMMGPRGEVVPLYASFSQPASLTRAVEGASMVVNLTGILVETRAGDFGRVHEEGARLIAAEAARAGVGRLVHVSAIGADPASDSRYGASKGRGEDAVRAAFAGATILRPSIVFGTEDKFFNLFAGLARLSPVMPVFSGDTLMQPVWAGDVADAVLVSLEDVDVDGPATGQLFELGGPEVLSFRAIIRWILDEIDRKRVVFDMPASLARLQAGLLERVPGKPLTRDQLTMLAHDNVVGQGALGFERLGLTPAPLDLIVPEYLRRYRPGGKHRANAPL